ncbi:phosphopantetheine-binding protein, partial [Gordonia jacobaea]
YVLDARLGVVPPGVPGELYLGGVQVARGYASRAGLSAERFVADPFGGGGSRLYRTGDLVRWGVGGEIEYLGRTDFQVKLRGQRVELGEVEAVVAAAPGVVHAVCAVVDGGGGQQLVGYVSPGSVDVDVVGEYVSGVLPGYMCPSVWVVTDELVLNSSGKLDRRALPPVVVAEVGFVAPVSSSQVLVAQVFERVLGVSRVGLGESFFLLGGNSLSAMRVAAGVADVFGVSVSVRDVFDAPTVEELA